MRWRLPRRSLLHLGVALVVAATALLLLFTPVRVEGFSMAPRLANNERLFIDKYGVRLLALRRGDVVVFRYPRDPRESFIKRIVGLPGEHVRIAAGNVYIDNHRLIEPYLAGSDREWEFFPDTVVPAGEYFVLGDNRNFSNDSRAWGCLPADAIYGRAVFAYWPVGRFGPID